MGITISTPILGSAQAGDVRSGESFSGAVAGVGIYGTLATRAQGVVQLLSDPLTSAANWTTEQGTPVFGAGGLTTTSTAVGPNGSPACVVLSNGTFPMGTLASGGGANTPALSAEMDITTGPQQGGSYQQYAQGIFFWISSTENLYFVWQEDGNHVIYQNYDLATSSGAVVAAVGQTDNQVPNTQYRLVASLTQAGEAQFTLLSAGGSVLYQCQGAMNPILTGSAQVGIGLDEQPTITGITVDGPAAGWPSLRPGTADLTLPSGIYDAANTVVGDPNLVPGNIAAGVTVFGVTGSSVVAAGTAAPADVLSGITFTSAQSANTQTGSVPTVAGGNTITPGTANQTAIAAATYADAAITVAGDANLAAANILTGKSIFGVAGSVIQASGDASAAQVLTGYTASNSSGGISGSMPNNGAPTLEPGAAITAGYYSGGSVAAYPHGSQTFSAPGAYSFTVPANVTQVNVIMAGGGGGGLTGGGGGGAGGACSGTLSVSPGDTVSGTVGSGGAGAASGTGNNGSATTLIHAASSWTADGGYSGNAASPNYTLGGNANGAPFNGPGGNGFLASNSNNPGYGGNSIFGAGSSSTISAAAAGAGGFGTSSGATAGGSGQVVISW